MVSAGIVSCSFVMTRVINSAIDIYKKKWKWDITHRKITIKSAHLKLEFCKLTLGSQPAASASSEWASAKSSRLSRSYWAFLARLSSCRWSSLLIYCSVPKITYSVYYLCHLFHTNQGQRGPVCTGRPATPRPRCFSPCRRWRLFLALVLRK